MSSEIRRFPREFSGVARNLDPCETACCGTEDWDYLICGLGTESDGPEDYDALRGL